MLNVFQMDSYGKFLMSEWIPLGKTQMGFLSLWQKGMFLRQPADQYDNGKS